MTEPGGEIDILRRRIADLDAEVARLEARIEQDRPLSVREALLVEAERVAHLGSWMWDLRTHEVSWSDEFYRIVGIDPAVRQASPEAFFGALHPDDLGRVQTVTQRSVETGVPERVEFRFVRASGEIREIVMSGAFLRNEAGEIVRMVGGCLDVTDWRVAEREAQRSQVLLEMAERLSGVGVFFFEPAAGSTHWSPEMHEIFGVGTPLDRQGFQAMVVPDDRPAVQAMQGQLQRLGETKPVAFRIQRPSGEIRHLLMSARLTAESGAVGGSIVDITDRIRLEEQLRRAQKMEAIGRLAGGVAHDFNNLLTVILSNADLWRAEHPESEEAGEVIQAANGAAALTRQLLAFSRQAMIEPRVLDLNAVARGTENLIRRVIGEDVEVRLESAPAPCAVRADANQLVQILLNLAVNSRDAMPHGGTIGVRTDHVELSPERRPAGSRVERFIELRVWDDGAGMDEVTRQRVFEPFFTTKGPGEGTGLGLATVFGIVTQHGGCIELDSRPGEGTEFRIYLPESTDEITHEGLIPVPEPISDPEGAILLVEDETPVRNAVRRLLEKAGYRVHSAALPSAALEVDDPTVQLLITDLVMPEGGGVELAEQLRSERPGLRVLYMTGHAPGEGSRPDAPVLLKPFSSPQLLAKVREILES